MTWERRLLEMILAGGALASAGCSTAHTDTGSDAAIPSPFCCNANGDPCCEFLSCGGPMTLACACEQEGGVLRAGSLADGGQGNVCGPEFPEFDASPGCCNANPDPCCPVLNCGAAMTAACGCAEEGGVLVSETLADGGQGNACVTPVAPCCNANPDPCCPALHCGAPMTPECACEQDGGTCALDDAGTDAASGKEAGADAGDAGP